MGKKTDFLYLNEAEMIQAGVLDSKHCIDIMDEMFRLMGEGDYVMGGPNSNEHGIMMHFPKEKDTFPGMPADGPDRRFMAMIAYLGGRFHISGVKWYGSNVVNPKRGLPRSVLMIMLNDPDTCEPIALMSGNLVSAVRTGAIPGVAVRHLARKDSKVCAIIGAGPVNKACFQAIASEMKELKKVVVYDLLPEAAENFIHWAQSTFHIEGVIASSTEEALRQADINSIAASGISPVEIKNEWIIKGSTTILTGLSRIEESFWYDSKLVFDNAKMHAAYYTEAHESEDVEEAFNGMIAGRVFSLIKKGKLPKVETYPSLGEVAIGKKEGRANEDERLILVTGGMPTEDLAWAYEVYKKAESMGLGQKLKLWEEPYWS